MRVKHNNRHCHRAGLLRLGAGGIMWGLLMLMSTATAGSLIPLAVEQLAEASQIVVFGTVNSKTCLRDEAGRIYTKVEIDVKETWKGVHPEGKPISVVHGGGTLGERRVVVSNQVNYRIGEEVVAFLRWNQRGEAVTIAMCQGKFDVLLDKMSGERHVRNTFHGGAPRAGAAEKYRLPTELPITLGSLRRQVQLLPR